MVGVHRPDIGRGAAIFSAILMTPLVQFHYSAPQWQALEEIVERAGGNAARGKFNAQRAGFEKTVGGWKERLEHWNGRALSVADADAYKRLGRRARELNAVFGELAEAATNDRLPFPAILTGHDLVWKGPAETNLIGHDLEWKGLAETNENQERFAKFREALEHVAKRADEVTEPKPKQALLARNTFFQDLGHVWGDELGLRVTTGVEALFVRFVEAASEGVYRSRKVETARDAIVNSMRSWPRRPRCKNPDEKT
jgi:hypothetical protein